MVPECRHIKTSGGKCGSPALRGKPYCYFHARLKQRAARPASPYLALELPALEDRGSIQIAISEVVSALADARIEPKRAGILLYALQIASSNARHSEEIVSSNSVEEVVQTEEGEEMALEDALADGPEEESLKTLVLKELKKQIELTRELSSDYPTQLADLERCERAWQVKGVSPDEEDGQEEDGQEDEDL
jgi:hypothetical protein